MAIHYLNGKRLSRAVVACSHRVLEVQELLNRINVFPVPDGDTGTNMALTLHSIAEVAINGEMLPLGVLSSDLADAALLNSRGNSGAVLAQFFQGMAEGFSGRKKVLISDFIDVMDHAVKLAETAFLSPREGTILTVMRDWMEGLKAFEEPRGFIPLLKSAFSVAKKSLADTPTKLKVLAQAGVVDAGGQGFVNMLEGLHKWMETGRIEWTYGDLKTDDHELTVSEGTVNPMLPFCTECLLEGKGMDPAQIRQEAKAFGDSLIVAGNANKIRVHIHTGDPDGFFAHLGQTGKVALTKVEDMRDQNLKAGHRSQTAIVTDSSCDLPMDFLIQHGVHLVPVSVTFGSRTFLDRVDITSDVIYTKMKNEELPTTSQPTPGAFLQAYEVVHQTHSQAIAILLSSTLSGTFQSGQLAAEKIMEKSPDINLSVIDSKSTAGAMGFLVKIAAEGVELELSAEEICRRVRSAIPYTRLILMVGTMDYLIHGGRVGKLKGLLAKWLNLVPILTLKSDGRIHSMAKVRPTKAPHALLKHVLADLKKSDFKDPQFIISHAHAETTARWLEEQLRNLFPASWMVVLPASPTVGAHVGPGACGIAYFGLPGGKAPWD